MTKKEQFLELLQRYREGTLTPEEKRLLDAWYNSYGAESLDELDEAELARTEAELQSRLPLAPPARVRRLWPRIAAAAAIILVSSAGLFYYRYRTATDQNAKLVKQDVKPGGNKAYLTLANGSKILLTDAKPGQLAKQTGITITKAANGLVVYSIANTIHNTSATKEYNTIETPKGGQYQVKLQDGTEVWLNAASSLRYPVSFTSLKDRKVILTGEGYFQVAKDKAHPFIVTTATETVEVLGTHFNINSYSDEPSTKTTLLEGAVRVSSLAADKTRILKPGEQAALTGTGIDISAVDVDETVAWKNGKFVFNTEPIESVMRKLGRWYNVEIEYRGDFKDRVFTGSISRYDNISKILDKIELTRAVNFKIAGRRIIVMP